MVQHHRIRQEEMEKAIWRPNENKQAQLNELPVQQTLVFTIKGQEDELVNEHGQPNKDGFPLLYDIEYADGNYTYADQLDNAYAKSVKSHNTYRYFIKCGRDGFYNPTGMYDENRHAKKQRAGVDLYKFMEVGYKTFMFYLNFLKTRNPAWLKNANREVI